MGESRIAGIGTRMVAQAPSIDIPERQGKAEEVMFADMISMNGSADTDNFTADVADEMLSTVETYELDTRREKPADAYEKYQYKDKTIRTETSDSKPQKVEEAVAEIKEFEEAVTEVVAEELHVSKEELEAAMEALGLTYLDLLDKGNLANLVAKLTGSESMNQLLCNEAFMNVLQQVSELGKELLAEVQMTPEELVEFQKVLEQQMTTEAQTPVNQESEKADVDKASETVADDVNPLQNVKSEVAEVENAEATEDGIKVEVVRVDATEGQQQSTSEENLSEKEQEFAGKAGKQNVQMHGAQVNENVVVNQAQNTTFTEQLGNFETVQTLPPHVTVADIMEQFAEHVRVSIAVDTTKMEMQLNPENLGKLYVEVIENEGSITAKIQTQNAVVKEALEMQIADLKVNLSQAGVKVDSVEVTIASHEFERNLEQDANSKKQQEDAEAKTTRHRNINLNGLDELSGLMTEEETLVAKMMAEQGNSVDFTA